MDHDEAINNTKPSNNRKLLIPVIVIVVIILGVGILAKKSSFMGLGGNKPTPTSSNSKEKGGKMYLASTFGNHVFPVNEEFSLDLYIDTNSQEVGGYDAVISYDDSILEFVKAENLVSDFEMFSNELPSTSDTYTFLTITGIMKLEKQKPVAFQKEPVSRLIFRAKRAGSTALEFKFTQGETDDSNIVLMNTKEILDEVESFNVSFGDSHSLKVGKSYTDPTSKLTVKLVKIITPDSQCNDCTTDAELELTRGTEKALLTFSNGGFAGKIADTKAALGHDIEVSNITDQAIDVSIIFRQ